MEAPFFSQLDMSWYDYNRIDLVRQQQYHLFTVRHNCLFTLRLITAFKGTHCFNFHNIFLCPQRFVIPGNGNVCRSAQRITSERAPFSIRKRQLNAFTSIKTLLLICKCEHNCCSRLSKHSFVDRLNIFG